MLAITLKDVWKVLHADLIGKDSHRGITLTYGWFANQVGHFALGFVPSYFLHSCFNFTITHATLYTAIFWTVFETYNVLSPLYKKEYKGNKSFKVQWGNIVFDMFTDLCFFWIGCTLYYLSQVDNKQVLIIFISCLFLMLFSIRYWFLTKLYQQNALFPYQFRLSQWDVELQKNSIELITTFLKQKPDGQHFIVLGNKGKGKTRLMVGMANEFSIRHRKCTYTTMSKWASMLEEDDQTLVETSFSIWNWSNAHFLLIDDINPGNPKDSNKTSSNETYMNIVRTHENRNVSALRTMNVAWIVGECCAGETPNDWKEMIHKLNVSLESIHIINLNHD